MDPGEPLPDEVSLVAGLGGADGTYARLLLWRRSMPEEE